MVVELQCNPMPTLQEKSTSTVKEGQCIQIEDESTQTWSDGSVYKGFFKDGRRHGKGEERWPNGEVSFYFLL